MHFTISLLSFLVLFKQAIAPRPLTITVKPSHLSVPTSRKTPTSPCHRCSTPKSLKFNAIGESIGFGSAIGEIRSPSNVKLPPSSLKEYPDFTFKPSKEISVSYFQSHLENRLEWARYGIVDILLDGTYLVLYLDFQRPGGRWEAGKVAGLNKTDVYTLPTEKLHTIRVDAGSEYYLPDIANDEEFDRFVKGGAMGCDERWDILSILRRKDHIDIRKRIVYRDSLVVLERESMPVSPSSRCRSFGGKGGSRTDILRAKTW